jgi:hypothetical protein
MYAMVRILRGMFGFPFCVRVERNQDLWLIRVLHPLDFVLFEKWSFDCTFKPFCSCNLSEPHI